MAGKEGQMEHQHSCGGGLGRGESEKFCRGKLGRSMKLKARQYILCLHGQAGGCLNV